jgi:flagellar protein FlaF
MSDPYTRASAVYGQKAEESEADQRDTEIRVLNQAARRLQNIYDDFENATLDDIHNALRYNRKIWLVFFDTAAENPNDARPQDLRNNIANLANFIFQREAEVWDVIGEERRNKLEILITINREVAGGLMDQKKREKQEAGDQAQNAPGPAPNSPYARGGTGSGGGTIIDS